MTTETQTGMSAGFDLHGRRVWITGASRGLGRSVAQGFLDAGADVALTARTVEPLEDLRRTYEGTGQRILVLPCSVGDSGEVDRAAAQIAAA